MDVDRNQTLLRGEVPPPPPQHPSGASAQPVTAQPRLAPSGPVSEFNARVHNRGEGLNSRSAIPVLLSFGTFLAVLIVLLVYFANHST